MFSKAYEEISNFMYPGIFLTKTIDKIVNTGLCAFIILNDEGWIITVAHINVPFAEYQKHQKERKEFQNIIKQTKRKRAKPIKENQKWIENISYWWGRDNIKLVEQKIQPHADLMLGRLEPFDQKMVKKYPTIKKHTKNKFGTSLCKFGYPLYQIKATFDESKNKFIIAPDTFPIPRFPIEGIYTRDIDYVKDGKKIVKFIETSSPGLKGQSGGPITDIEGNIWSIQSKTYHHPLGFNPKVKEKEEHQFLNTGVGPHPSVIVEFLNNHGIKFNLSKD